MKDDTVSSEDKNETSIDTDFMQLENLENNVNDPQSEESNKDDKSTRESQLDDENKTKLDSEGICSTTCSDIKEPTDSPKSSLSEDENLVVCLDNKEPSDSPKSSLTEDENVICLHISDSEKVSLADDEILVVCSDIKESSDTAKPSLTEDENLVVCSVASSSMCCESLSSSEEKNKRKLEVETEFDSKKFKKDVGENGDSNYLNGEESSTSSTSGDFGLKNTNIEELVTDVTVADYKALDKINTLIPWNPSEKIETTKSVLDRIAVFVCQEVVKESFPKKHLDETVKVKELEKKIENLSSSLDKFRVQFADFRDTQKTAFFQHNFKAKLQTRTVGVNVKIYRESELKQAMQQNKQSVQSVLKNKLLSRQSEDLNVKKENSATETKPDVSSISSNIIKREKPGPTQIFVPSTQINTSVTPSILQPQQINIRRQLLPRIITQTNRPMVNAQVVTRWPQRIPPPNVTVRGNHIIPLVSSRPRAATTHSVVLVPSSSITSSARNNLIDLTKEEQARNAANGTSVPTTKVAAMPNNPNVLVPLRDYLQLLPPGPKGSPVVQPVPTSVQRPTLIPQLPSSLLGARTVTYFVPQNSGIGGRGIPQFLPQSNPPVQFVLRVTAPGAAPTLGTVVNSNTRFTAVPQTTSPQVSSAPRTSSGLVLISHTSKHPAPFPKSPLYPDNKGKSLPPKPSLKGNKNSNGIVLSWNMSLLSHHATISSYQLFAYQEAEGPVDASLWKKVGDVNALPLPMACTLTQFIDKNRYYFTVRAVDIHQRCGPFSDPVSIYYDKEGESPTKK